MRSTLLTNLSTRWSIVVYRYCHTLDLEKLSILHNWSFIAIEQQLCAASSPQSLATTILVFVSVSLTILDASYKWNHAEFFLWMAYFTWHNAPQAHPGCHIQQESLLFWKLDHFHCAHFSTHSSPRPFFHTHSPSLPLCPASLAASCFLNTAQACSQLRTSMFSDPSSWSVLPPSVCMVHCLASLGSALRGHLSGVFPDCLI